MPNAEAPKPAPTASTTAADEVASRLTGTMDSSWQSLVDGDYFDVTLTHCPVTVPEAAEGDVYLLAVQSLTMTRDRPYRVRFVRLQATGPDAVRSTTFAPETPIAGCDPAAEPLRVELAALGKERCTTELRREGSEFVGRTRPGECASSHSGASYMTTEVRLGESWLESWDRGFADDGGQVWGATKGAYRFERVTTTQRPKVVSIASTITGHSSNAEQARRGPGFVPVDYDICPVVIEGEDVPAGARTFFIRQAISLPGSPKPMIRKRIYAFYPGTDATLGFTSWDFAGDPPADLSCEAARATRVSIDPATIDWKSGCAMDFEPADKGAYTGTTKPGGCPSSYRGASKLTITATLRPGAFDIWERWFDADGKQVAGSATGPYEYRRIDASCQVPEQFQFHEGTWRGTALRLGPDGEVRRRFDGTFDIRISGCDYRQTNRYKLPKGERVLEFTGAFRGERLHLDSPSYESFGATAWVTSDTTIRFESTKRDKGVVYRYVETITQLGPNRRVRSSQIFTNDRFDGLAVIAETRVQPATP